MITWIRTRTLTFWIFVGLIFGILFGYFAPAEWSIALKPIGKLFIRLIKMIVSPLVFSSLVVGLVGAGKGHIGRLLFKSLVWFWAVTIVALVIGLCTVNLTKPGVGAVQHASNHFEVPAPVKKTIIEQVVPESIFQAMAENSILQIVFFSILFGMGLAAIGEAAAPVVGFLKGVTDTMFKVTEYVMKFAPIGVGAAMAAAIGAHGIEVLFSLFKMVGSLYLALFIFAVILLSAVKIIAKIKIKTTLKALEEPLVIAFSTTSSESALPKVIQVMEKLGVPSYIVNFVIPSGYSFNLAGTTLYLALASVFIAQAAGIEMTLTQQIIMMLTLMITSKGVAAVPRASLVVLSSTCATFGLPIEWIATILGVDELMDMARTTVNVLGNALSSVVIAKWEKDLPQDANLFSDTFDIDA